MQAAVASYLASSASTIKLASSSFNASGRAYPDLAALGHKTPLVVRGDIGYEDGTSMSAPVIASMMVHLNAIRLAAGQPVLGWFNPALYTLAARWPGIVNDITSGSNVCSEHEHDNFTGCPSQCNWGFNTAPGMQHCRLAVHAAV